ncbi:MAG: hypothetical protein A3G25_21430 [Betaproteobacteria bacterium RIFCSPLOWO2_12_FULL_63_13]|nr:MAG: hypothetical protein A3H32_16880 [Betaproteobacteria bacterium RIFCSPLOWO2_02_FULL_63_19]OGA48145.1 MAG: hypothetical protein A3G25_21430 [Betaproteobacteria bacterium RIFCSPLOWO2_12_FULL_63_13]
MKAFGRGSVFLVLMLWGSLSLAAKKEHWVKVERIDKNTGKKHVLYVDTGSVSRNGNVATINTRWASNMNEVIVRKFDCVRDKESASSTPVSKLVFEKACKRAWEIWK